jgi:hypothetical protein
MWGVPQGEIFAQENFKDIWLALATLLTVLEAPSLNRGWRGEG